MVLEKTAQFCALPKLSSARQRSNCEPDCRSSSRRRGITFVDRKNNAKSIYVENGGTAMHAAINHGMKGVVAECDGNALCATCHVYVDEPWISKVGPIGDDESTLLDRTAAARSPNSRLCCQIRVTPALDGLSLHLPDKQV
jgi:2Fe-2S ferredoxin